MVVSACVLPAVSVYVRGGWWSVSVLPAVSVYVRVVVSACVACCVRVREGGGQCVCLREGGGQGFCYLLCLST